MRLLHLAPYAALILLGEAAIATVPGVIAAREGGMGLGSALIVGQLAQVAGVALGATIAGYLVDRWSIHVAIIAGALLYYAGLISVGHQPSHLLGWVIVVLGVAGAGLGLVLTASFSAAAGVRTRDRPLAIAVLLLVSLVAGRLAAGAAFLAGVPTLVLVAAVVVAGAGLVVWFAGERPVLVEPMNGRAVEHEPQRYGLGTALVGGVLLAIGILATLWGVDPSRVSAALVAGVVGVGGFESLDGLQAGLILLGLVTLAGGAVLLLARRRPVRSTALAAAGLAPAALAVAGVLAVLGFAMPADLSAGDSRGGPAGGSAALAGGAAGLVIGAWQLARGVRRRAVALSGSLMLAAVTVIAIVGGGDLLRSSGAVIPLAATAMAAFGGGLAAAALRLLLADAPTGERGFAAAAGVAAASFGAMAGLMLGAGEGMALAFGGADTMSAGSLVLVAAALVAVGVAALLPSSRPTRAPAS